MRIHVEKAKVALCLAMCLVSTFVRAEEPVAYYRFGDDGSFLGDSSGNGNRLYQMRVETPSQRDDLAGQFPAVIPQTGERNVYFARLSGGSGDVRVLRSDGSEPFHTDRFTIEAYIQPDQVAGQHVIASQWDEGVGVKERSWRLLLRETDPSLVFQVSQDGITPVTVVLPVGELAGGETYYAAASVDPGAEGGDVALYFQKVSAPGQMLTLRRTLQSVTSLHRSSAPLLLGANLTSGTIRTDMLFSGAIDEVRFSGAALPAHRLLAVSPSRGFSFFLDGRPASHDSAGPVFHLSPQGDDTADGLSVDRPFRTLERSRDAVRGLLDAGETRTITVHLRGGRYVLEAPLVLGLEDGARAAGQQIVYEAAEGETPVLTSLMPVEGWEPVATLPEHVPPEAEGNLYRADIGAIADARRNAIAQGHSALWDWRIKVLYRDGTQVPRAKGDRFDPEVMHRNPAELGGGRQNLLAYPEGALREFADVQSAELHIIPRFDWSMNILPIEWVNEEERTAKTVVPGTYGLETTWKWKLRPCAWVENVPWGMRPGHWLLDSIDEVVYYWSEDGLPPEGVGASNGLLETIRVEGEIDYEGPEDIPVRGLVFRGLTFTEGARYTFPPDYKGGRWQHDWASYDVADALLRFRGAENCVVEQCRFINSAANGVRLDLHAQNITIRENEFGHLGECGVVLSGYGPGTKNVNRGNTVENNWFHHGAEHHWHASAIFIVQSGMNRIVNNRIHDYSYSGISVSGMRRLNPNPDLDDQRSESQTLVRWDEMGRTDFIEFPETIPYMHAGGNIIESNRIFRIMERLGDGCAIYLSCAGEGNVVRKNFVHHIRADAASALRSDDAQWDVTYEKNVVYKTTGHGIILKGPNRAINNVIIDQKDHFAAPNPSEAISVAIRTGPPEGIVVERNVFAQLEGKEPAFYYIRPTPHLSSYGYMTLETVKAAQVDSNVFWWAASPSKTKQTVSGIRETFGFDQNSLVEDPLFADPHQFDFSFRPGSPAGRFGIEPVDISGAGLAGEFRRRVDRPLPGRLRIEPQDEVFTGPVEVVISSDSTEGEIRYTLDGSKPGEESTRYTEPFLLTHPARVRARLFREGFVDWLGAQMDLRESTQPISEDFESDSTGASRSRIRYGGTGDGATIGLAPDPDPHRQGTALRFVRRGRGNRYQPVGFYQVVHGQGMNLSFDLWIEPESEMLIQWTESPQAAPQWIPSLVVEEDGSVAVLLGNEVREVLADPGTVRPGHWNSFALTVPSGTGDGGAVSPRMTVNDRPVDAFAQSRVARSLDAIRQINFRAATPEPVAFYLDHVNISSGVRRE